MSNSQRNNGENLEHNPLMPKTSVLETEWAWSTGVARAILVLSGEATLLRSSGVIPCACSEFWWNYLA